MFVKPVKKVHVQVPQTVVTCILTSSVSTGCVDIAYLRKANVEMEGMLKTNLAQKGAQRGLAHQTKNEKESLVRKKFPALLTGK